MSEPPMYLNQFAPPQPNRGRRTRLIVVTAVVAAVLLVAGAVTVGLALRSDGSETAGASSSPSPSASPSPSTGPAPQRFDTPQALITYLDSRGHTCNRYESVEGALNAVGRGRCYVGAAEVTVGVYAIHSDVEAQWQTMAGLLAGVSPVYMALGENWTVNGPEAWTRQVADTMGVVFRAQP